MTNLPQRLSAGLGTAEPGPPTEGYPAMGGSFRRRGRTLTSVEHHSLAQDGFVVLRDLLTHGECDDWSEMLDEAWNRDQATLSPHPFGDEQGVQFIRNALRHSADLMRCATEPVVLEAARSMLGPDVIVHLVNSRRVDPGHGLQPLHELDRPRPFTVCDTIWCLDEFTLENGATRVLPGTHLSDDLAIQRMVDPCAPHPDEVLVTASRGSVIVFNSRLIHSGTQNCSDRPRRSVQCNIVERSRSPHYRWQDLPPEVRGGLSPLAVHLLGLEEPEGEVRR